MNQRVFEKYFLEKIAAPATTPQLMSAFGLGGAGVGAGVGALAGALRSHSMSDFFKHMVLGSLIGGGVGAGMGGLHGYMRGK